MPELERQLAALGARLEFPPTPDLVTAVRARLAARPRRRRRLALALALLALALGVALAVPQARTAILDFFGIGGVRVQFVDRLPEVRPGHRLDLGRRATLAQAERRVGFPVLVPSLLGAPDRVYVRVPPVGGAVTLVYGGQQRVRALVTEFRARQGVGFAQKTIGPGTSVETLTVEGGRGAWISGRPHLFTYMGLDGGIAQDELRLARNTLLWERGDLTLRIEGDLEKADALRIAGSMR